VEVEPVAPARLAEEGAVPLGPAELEDIFPAISLPANGEVADEGNEAGDEVMKLPDE
jgi:hypothetical protein